MWVLCPITDAGGVSRMFAVLTEQAEVIGYQWLDEDPARLFVQAGHVQTELHHSEVFAIIRCRHCHGGIPADFADRAAEASRRAFVLLHGCEDLPIPTAEIAPCPAASTA